MLRALESPLGETPAAGEPAAGAPAAGALALIAPQRADTGTGAPEGPEPEVAPRLLVLSAVSLPPPSPCPRRAPAVATAAARRSERGRERGAKSANACRAFGTLARPNISEPHSETPGH